MLEDTHACPVTTVCAKCVNVDPKFTVTATVPATVVPDSGPLETVAHVRSPRRYVVEDAVPVPSWFVGTRPPESSPASQPAAPRMPAMTDFTCSAKP